MGIELIELNYTKAMQQSKDLEKIAKNIKKLSNEELVHIMKNIKKNWKGENSENYVEKLETLQENILKTAENLSSVATTIDTIATNTYQAELRALAAAQERTYMQQ